MDYKLTTFDKNYLSEAINCAENTYKLGNYSVGAVLVIDNKIIAKSGNEIKAKNSYFLVRT